MTKLSDQHRALLSSITQKKATAESVEATLRAEFETELRIRVAGAWQQVEDLMARANADGVSLRQIGMAYGSSNFNTIKERVDAGKSRIAHAPITEIPDEGIDPRAFITAKRLDNGLIEVEATNAPVAFWTFPEGTTSHPTEPFTGMVQFNWSGIDWPAIKNSGARELLVEWNKGTALDYIKEEIGG